MKSAICMKRYVNEYFFTIFFQWSTCTYGALGYLAEFVESNISIQLWVFWAVHTGLELMEWSKLNFLPLSRFYFNLQHAFLTTFIFSKLTSHLSWAIISNYLFCISKDWTFLRKKSMHGAICKRPQFLAKKCKKTLWFCN